MLEFSSVKKMTQMFWFERIKLVITFNKWNDVL